jgi:hypothetical protein
MGQGGGGRGATSRCRSVAMPKIIEVPGEAPKCCGSRMRGHVVRRLALRAVRFLALGAGCAASLAPVFGSAMGADTTATWGEADIRASHARTAGPHATAATLPDAKQGPAWLILEREDGALSLVDPARPAETARLALPGGRRGKPQWSPDGRRVYLGDAQGWVRAYALPGGQEEARVRAGHALTDLALSGDGRWLVVGLASPSRVVVLDAGLMPVRSWDARSRDGRRASAVAAVLDAPLRQSIVVMLRDLAELWEIAYDERAQDIYDGLVHDFRMGEGVPLRGFLNPRRSPLPWPVTVASLDADQSQLLATSPGQPGVQVINLDVRKRIGGFPEGALPSTGAAAAWSDGTRSLMLLPRATQPLADVLDMGPLTVVASVPLPDGPARAAVTAQPAAVPARGTRIWIDNGQASARGLLGLDAVRLQPVAHIAVPGAMPSPPSLGAHGCRLWVAVTAPAGLVLGYDTVTGAEQVRLSVDRPQAVWASPHAGLAAAGCGT